MKGVVFTEFLEMVDARYSPATTEEILAESELASGGAYSAIGTYDPRELGRLLAALGRATGQDPAALLRGFGEHLFGRFASLYPQFFVAPKSAFEMLSSVEEHIHVEVRKLYPDAELPRFDVLEPSEGELELTYRSSRGLADLAAGLIAGCVAHYGGGISIAREDLSGGKNTEVRFRLKRRG